jgi:hypothetical protein
MTAERAMRNLSHRGIGEIGVMGWIGEIGPIGEIGSMGLIGLRGGMSVKKGVNYKLESAESWRAFLL